VSLNTEEFLDFLLQEDIYLDEFRHAYDPVKAREYYLRTRQLKGRKKGVVKTSSRSSAAARAAKAKRLKAAAEARVFALKIRLQKLEDLLDKLTKEAKARSGVKTDSKSTSGSGSSSSTDRKPLTAAQKREAAKKQAERREKERDQSLSSEAKTLEAKIERARERIENIRVRIAIAQRSTAKTTQNGR
jgi:hypothetical protein